MGQMRLNFRSLLLVKGAGSKHFLQGLITKDMDSLTEACLIYTFLLNVKGRIFADMFIWRLPEESNGAEEAFVLETNTDRVDAIQKALKIYRLRRPIQITPLSDKQVCFCCAEHPTQSANNSHPNGWFEDPRVPGFGFRSLQSRQKEDEPSLAEESERVAYLHHRLRWAVAEGAEMQDQIPLNMNGDLMNAISFEKGCYIGQELVARTYHTGVVRRRLMSFRWSNPNAALAELKPGGSNEDFGGDLVLKDQKGRRQGKIICSHGELGLCLASVEAVPPATMVQLFDSKGRAIEVRRPEWWPNTTE